MTIIDLFNENLQISKWQANFNRHYRQLVMGLSDSSKAIVMASALDDLTVPKILVVTSSQHEAENLVSNLTSLLGEDRVYAFFADDIAAAEFVFASKDKLVSRVQALNFLQDNTASGILVVSQQACRVLLPSPQVYRAACFSLEMGQEVNLDALTKQLTNMGYTKTRQVQTQGEWSLRGDILDIFCLNEDLPYRLEFFGDEIDGIRTFDVLKQTSLTNLEQVAIYPASDVIVRPSDYERAVKRVSEIAEASQDEHFKSYAAELLGDFSQGQAHLDQRFFLSAFYEKSWTLLDYLPKHTPVFFDDYQKIMDSHAKFELDLADFITHRLEQGRAQARQTYFADVYSHLRQYKPSTFFSTFQKGLGNVRFDALFQLNQHKMQEFFSQIPLLKEEVQRFVKSGATVMIQADSDASLQTLKKTLQDYDLDLPKVANDQLVKGQAQLVVGQLPFGFNFIDEKLVLITEHEIFNKKIKRKARRAHLNNAERLKDYQELEKGDYVVHHVHGIGQFLGIETIEISGVHRDYLTIQYQNADRISLPVEQIELLTKYVSSDGKEPKINKLNDGRFKKAKQRVTKQVADIADELIKLYAERSQLQGFAFSPDDNYQEEFDEDFPYVETEDQLRSIKEVKQDMESTQPMDRLLVGDVGFGKTEVAMRAAFKAVNDHKQVAILVPTTVLAQQHYNNFLERFIDFPVTIEVLSRFKSKKQQEEILERVRKGQVDIIIGTHRLLSNDVNFADLGLLVIDEEQRFGVRHKEKLKALKLKVDVLTLTATPIPRTLHMSMLGIRDLSVIETPPINRYPVQTYVMEMQPQMVRDGILREIDRGGQVFYLHNRVDTIEQKVSELQDLVPEATIGFIHGQMSEVQMENTLLDFINGDYDVLVTTTIIETGVDIPNANTLFIENADHMGLSTLYQLRGRVGRSSRIAYAYFMYRPDKVLTEVAEKRLEAIRGFTDLGSGFKIAMRDLSIRGAGDLLGSSQSGFIDAVGFDLYSQLLEEAIAEKQGKTKLREHSNSELNLKIDAYLPSDYISDERQKIEIYKQIRDIKDQSDYEQLQADLIDRFGDYPDVVAYLLEIGLIKSYADQAFVSLIERKGQQILVKFEATARRLFLTQDYFEALSQTALKAQISEEKDLMTVIFNATGKKDYEILEALLLFSEKLVAIKARKKD